VQAVVNEHQIVVAAEVTLSSPDFGQLEPMLKATQRELQQIGVSDTPGVAVADSGYWHEEQIEQVVNMGTQVLIPPDAGKREKPRHGWTGGRYAFMLRRTLGMAADHRDSQPDEAPQAPPGRPGRLKRHLGRTHARPGTQSPISTSTTVIAVGVHPSPAAALSDTHRPER
jgi:hypothetical protein